MICSHDTCRVFSLVKLMLRNIFSESSSKVLLPNCFLTALKTSSHSLVDVDCITLSFKVSQASLWVTMEVLLGGSFKLLIMEVVFLLLVDWKFKSWSSLLLEWVVSWWDEEALYSPSSGLDEKTTFDERSWSGSTWFCFGVFLVDGL